VRYAVHNMAESISSLFLDAKLGTGCEVVCNNDVHKVTARNKWRCREKEMFVYINVSYIIP
jgi:hypothetical protein